MISAEILKTVKGSLINGDQVLIANRTGFSRAWVNQILNGKRGTESEESQRVVIEAALDIVAKRKSDQKKKDKKWLDKVNAILA